MSIEFAVREIKRRKIESLTNIIGYAFATCFLIIIITLAQGYNVVASGELRGIGTHFVAYIPESTSCPCQTFTLDEFPVEVGPYFKDVYTTTFPSGVLEKIGDLEGVEDVAPYLMFRLDNLTIGGIEVDSLATEATVVSQNTVVAGRYLETTDYNDLLVDQVFAELLDIEVGNEIHVFGRTFSVIGIVDPAAFSKPAGIANMYGLLNEVQELVNYYGERYNFLVDEINVVLVEIAPVGDSDYINNVKNSVLETLELEVGTKGTIAGYQCGVKARSVISLNEDSAWMISLSILVAATLYSARSQISTVTERTKEIGLLKSIGWTNFDVTKQTLTEAILQTSLGGFIGVIIGYLIVFLIPFLGIVVTKNLVLRVPPEIVAIGLLSAILGGTVAGILSARQASKLKPAEALRHI